MPPVVNQTLGERVSALEATVAVKAASICADINEVKADFKELKEDINTKFNQLSEEIANLTAAQSQRVFRDKVVGSVLEFAKLATIGLLGFFAQAISNWVSSGGAHPPGHG